MYRLEQFAQADPQWTLEQLVEIANDLLPQLLPEKEVNQKVHEEVNPRLVRHYTTLELIEKPIKEGREARYTYRHLLQLLVVRRLLMEGYSASSMQKMTLVKDNSELESLLQGGVAITVQAINPALAFLQQIQVRSSAPTATKLVSSSSPIPASSPPLWIRLEILPGLEIHVREDFVYPSSTKERQKLLQLISQTLLTLFSQWRRSK